MLDKILRKPLPETGRRVLQNYGVAEVSGPRVANGIERKQIESLVLCACCSLVAALYTFCEESGTYKELNELVT